MSPAIKTCVVCFWLVAMSWLAWTKLLPGMLGGERPEYGVSLGPDDVPPRPDCWKIRYRDRTIGFAATQVRREESALGLRSIVHFESLPLQSMANEMFGVMAAIVRPLVEANDLEVEMLVASQVDFDEEQRFAGFQTRVDLAETPDFLIMTGETDATGVLNLVARLGGPFSGESAPRIERRIDLPSDALVHDRFAPRPELKNLEVGQTWTVPVYRPFPPNSAPQIIQARVKRHEIIFWEGEDVETKLVEYRSEAGSGINITNTASGREWVRGDGTVLRQEVTFSGLTLQFERLAPNTQDPRLEWLDENKTPRLWQPAELSEDPTLQTQNQTP